MYIYLALVHHGTIDYDLAESIASKLEPNILNEIINKKLFTDITYVNSTDFTQFTITSNVCLSDEQVETIIKGVRDIDWEYKNFYKTFSMWLDDVI